MEFHSTVFPSFPGGIKSSKIYIYSGIIPILFRISVLSGPYPFPHVTILVVAHLHHILFATFME